MEDRNELVALGSRVKQIRENLNLSQREFADKCGLSKTYIGMLERGERNPSYLTLLQIAKCFGITLEKLIHKN